MKELTQERLKEVLDYDSSSGVFRWKYVKFSSVDAGTVAGTKKHAGHLGVKIDKKQFYLHQLAWLWVYGEVPTGEIDHINGVPDDNRIINLRHVDRKTNAQNQRRAQTNNKLGIMGVCKSGAGFRARLTVGDTIKCLGTYSTAEEAHQAFLKAKREFHEGCTI